MWGKAIVLCWMPFLLALWTDPSRLATASSRLLRSQDRQDRHDCQDCQDCHVFPSGLTHPLGVVPKAKASGGLPLGPGNRITCLTCHDERSQQPEHQQARQERSAGGPMLRLSPRRLCQSCHQVDLGRGTAVDHGAASGRAHLLAKDGAEPRGPGMDRESRLCLSCHDGTVASFQPVTEWKSHVRLRAEAGVMQRPHPVGMVYGEAFTGRRQSSLRPTHLVPPQVRLVEGKVGCASCHSFYSGQEFMLSMPVFRSRLCQSCHQK